MEFFRNRSFGHHLRLCPLVMAHRGGAGLWPENTLYAFAHATQMGVDVLEVDVHCTSDGVPVVIHDGTVDRTTNNRGRVNEMTLLQLKALDAAYGWSLDGGRTYPLRGCGIAVPTLQEVFEAFSGMRFNIDIKQKQPSMVQSFCQMIRDYGMTKNVLVASFEPEVLEEFRRDCGEVATSAGPADIRAFLMMDAAQFDAAHRLNIRALQVPEYAGNRCVLTRNFVEAAHARDLEVHAWTINDESAMQRLIDVGVDGIITDYPDRLLALLKRHESLSGMNGTQMPD